MGRAAASVVLTVALVVACGGDDGGHVPTGARTASSAAGGAAAADAPAPRSTAATTTTAASPPTAATAPVPSPATAPPPTAGDAPAVVGIHYRFENRSSDGALADAGEVVHTTLVDARGWQRAGFRFERRADAPYVVVLAEPDDAQALCRPYDVYRRYSCQNGPLVVLNADRWRTATPQWTGDLATYRQMLVNHEVGHLLGMRHPPRPQCPARGRPAPVMAQQSTELDGCLPNAWPLDHEVARAARHDQPLAPAYGE